MKKECHLKQLLCKGLLILCLQLFVAMSIFGENLYGQQHKVVTVSLKNVTLLHALEYLTNVVGCEILYNHEQVKSDKKFDLEMANKTLEEVLTKCLEGTNLTYKIVDDVFVLTGRVKDEEKAKEIKGVVVDVKGDSIPGVTVMIKGTTIGTSTDAKGMFKMTIPSNIKDLTLVFSFIGMESQEIQAGNKTTFLVVLKEKEESLDEVIVTGYSNIKKSSFTGNAIQISKDELLKVSKRNVIAALQTFDPSLRIVENNEWGSNPNRVPEFYIRGRSGIGTKALDKQTLENNPNTPTFIMDGFEVSSQKVYDMDPERIETITILKDAAATAMYGSRAANGVIVITTVAPKPGEVRVDYSMVGSISFPDLSDYNLMNAAEKLEAEKRAGFYDGVLNEPSYYEKYEYIARGVDTYWIGQPLRNAFGHKHSIYIQGGVESIRYSLDLSYNNNAGVMKDSYRKNLGAGLTIDYRYKGLQIKNYFAYKTNEAQESPYGNFAEYTKQLPYNEMKDKYGNYKKTLTYGDFDKANPLYEATLSNFDQSSYREIEDNIGINWIILDGLQIKGTFGVTQQWNKSEKFIDPLSRHSPNSSSTGAEGDFNLLRGELTRGSGELTTWDLNVMLMFNRSLNNHHINATLAYNARGTKQTRETYVYRGFPSGDLCSPAYAESVYNKPSFGDNLTRMVGLIASANYDYNNIYLADLSFRLDASSEFGDKKRSAPFWAGGIGINIHNYNFLKDNSVLTLLKLRTNYGETGKVNFPAYAASTTYQAQLDNWYSSGYGVFLMALGNKNLTWEKTKSLDFGVEFELFNGILFVDASWYKKTTQDLISDVTIPLSSGFSSYKENLGEVENKGIEINLRGDIYKDKDIAASVFANLSRNKGKIKKISNSLKDYNNKVNDYYNSTSTNDEDLMKPLLKYEEGQTLTAIWGVQSLGIDPATGQDMLQKRDGSITYNYSPEDQIVLGDEEPDARGSFGLNLSYKGFSLFTSFMYEFGGQSYNQTLVSKVENVDLAIYNADKRVLTDRWNKAGDHAKFKSIKDHSNTTKPVSRFVQDNNWLKLSSLTLGYDFQRHSWMKKIHLNTLRVEFNMNDIMHISSIKKERGLSYPFANTMGFTVKVGF